MKPTIYLATAYSYNPAEGYATALRCTAALIRAGHVVFSPIVHSHALAEHGGLDADWETWREYDLALLARFDELWVYADAHWASSTGVQAEVQHAAELRKPLVFVDPSGAIIGRYGHEDSMEVLSSEVIGNHIADSTGGKRGPA